MLRYKIPIRQPSVRWGAAFAHYSPEHFLFYNLISLLEMSSRGLTAGSSSNL